MVFLFWTIFINSCIILTSILKNRSVRVLTRWNRWKSYLGGTLYELLRWSFCINCLAELKVFFRVPDYFRYCQNCGSANPRFDSSEDNWMGSDAIKKEFCYNDRHEAFKIKRIVNRSFLSEFFYLDLKLSNYCPFCGVRLKK